MKALIALLLAALCLSSCSAVSEFVSHAGLPSDKPAVTDVCGITWYLDRPLCPFPEIYGDPEADGNALTLRLPEHYGFADVRDGCSYSLEILTPSVNSECVVQMKITLKIIGKEVRNIDLSGDLFCLLTDKNGQPLTRELPLYYEEYGRALPDVSPCMIRLEKGEEITVQRAFVLTPGALAKAAEGVDLVFVTRLGAEQNIILPVEIING